MFLNELPRELVSPYLDLAYTLISSDGELAEEELSLMQMYAIELNLDQLPQLSSGKLEDVLQPFLSLALVEKKKIYFELFSLAYADSEFAQAERAMLNQIVSAFDIPREDAAEIENITIKLLFDYEQLGSIING